MFNFEDDDSKLIALLFILAGVIIMAIILVVLVGRVQEHELKMAVVETVRLAAEKGVALDSEAFEKLR